MTDEVQVPSLTVATEAPKEESDARDIASLLVEKFDQQEGAEAPGSEEVTTQTEPMSQSEGEPVAAPQESPEELQAGYLRQRDYTKKTQELAQQKRQIEESYTAMRKQYEDQMILAQQYMQGGADPVLVEAQKTNWTKLAQDDPAGYVARRAQVEQKIAEMQNLSQQGNEARQRQLKDVLARESEQLYAKLPEWKDEKVRTQEINELSDYLQRNGFKREEVESTIDHRALVLARKSMLYDKFVEAKNKLPEKRVQAKPSSTIRPRGGDTSVTGTRNKAAIDRAKQTGRNDDIVKAILSNI